MVSTFLLVLRKFSASSMSDLPNQVYMLDSVEGLLEQLMQAKTKNPKIPLKAHNIVCIGPISLFISSQTVFLCGAKAARTAAYL
jgi:hypothetical protein